MVQIGLYISQIRWVSPIERIRYYLRDIKHVLFSMFTEDYQGDHEYDEDEDEKSRKESELAELQRQARISGIEPPIR